MLSFYVNTITLPDTSSWKKNNYWINIDKCAHLMLAVLTLFRKKCIGNEAITIIAIINNFICQLFLAASWIFLGNFLLNVTTLFNYGVLSAKCHCISISKSGFLFIFIWISTWKKIYLQWMQFPFWIFFILWNRQLGTY